MNNTVFYDSDVSDDVRRQRLYDGQLFVYSRRSSILAFTDFAKSMIEDAFGGLEPRTAQKSMHVERYAEMLGKLKPAFIHHPESKRQLKAILEDLGFRPRADIFVRTANAQTDDRELSDDRHRLRLATSSRYLVLSPRLSDQLVAAHLRDRIGQHDGIPSALLDPAGQK